MSIPTDLVPLPTMPYDERPDSLPLDVEECRTALWRVRGNITEAANLLKVPSNRLRNFIRKSPRLMEEQREAVEQIIDIAENVVYDALTDEEDKGRRDSMAKFVLSGQGKSRGWGSGSSGNININTKGGPVTISWEDGAAFGQPTEPKTIEGEVVREAAE